MSNLTLVVDHNGKKVVATYTEDAGCWRRIMYMKTDARLARHLISTLSDATSILGQVVVIGDDTFGKLLSLSGCPLTTITEYDEVLLEDDQP